MVLLGNIGRISLESPWDSGALSLQPGRPADDDLEGSRLGPRNINLLAIFLVWLIAISALLRAEEFVHRRRRLLRVAVER